METSPCIVPPGEPLSSTGDLILSEARKEELLTRLSNAITKELHIIVEWSKLVPGFSNLQRQDQIALLMAAGMELVVFRVIYRSIPFKEQIFMNTTSCLDRIDCYSILNQEIVDMILDVVERIRPLHVDEVEFACMEAILLLDAGNRPIFQVLLVIQLLKWIHFCDAWWFIIRMKVQLVYLCWIFDCGWNELSIEFLQSVVLEKQTCCLKTIVPNFSIKYIFHQNDRTCVLRAAVCSHLSSTWFI